MACASQVTDMPDKWSRQDVIAGLQLITMICTFTISCVWSVFKHRGRSYLLNFFHGQILSSHTSSIRAEHAKAWQRTASRRRQARTFEFSWAQEERCWNERHVGFVPLYVILLLTCCSEMGLPDVINVDEDLHRRKRIYEIRGVLGGSLCRWLLEWPNHLLFICMKVRRIEPNLASLCTYSISGRMQHHQSTRLPLLPLYFPGVLLALLVRSGVQLFSKIILSAPSAVLSGLVLSS
ncbi:hypothetical protein CC86DRAFT_210303 [Ophiobolus disseminans]|uniref:Uncharacterized protein n=1 Tax=Ophiobolus disseminans TaxID=1469910 RepID=A0A6A7A253_9PLEO|nr:hypothetical protein CC86DRAFT_210303 [Ophiobolus disseminans]